MSTTVAKAWDILKLIPRGGSDLCNVAVTNSCNATCDSLPSFFGGETLLHPRLHEMVAMVVARNMGPLVIINGWLLPARLEQLAEAGLKTAYISIDSAQIDEHEGKPGT